MKKIIQIVPRINEGRDGVGDYGLSLARELRKVHAIQTTFVCGNPYFTGVNSVDGFRICHTGVSRRVALDRILKQEGRAPIFLQYVAPGYDYNSCPFWLAASLKDWKLKSRENLFVFMHEFYSEGPPWTRSFWTNPFQKWIGCQVVQLADAAATNVRTVKERMTRLIPTAGNKLRVLPIFSNVGEARDPLAPLARHSWLAIFGSASWRRKAYEEFRADLKLACDVCEIEEILDIGESMHVDPLPGVGFRHLGNLPANQVASYLEQCRFGFVTYPKLWLGKSGIFAAYAANGCVPILPAKLKDPSADAPTIEIGARMMELDLKAVQAQVGLWYRSHNVAEHANYYAQLVRSNFNEIEADL